MVIRVKPRLQTVSFYLGLGLLLYSFKSWTNARQQILSDVVV